MGGGGFDSWLGWVAMRRNGGGHRVDEVRGVRVQPRLLTCISCRVLQQSWEIMATFKLRKNHNIHDENDKK